MRKYSPAGWLDKQATRRRTDPGIRHTVDAAVQDVVHEPGRETDGHQGRNPGRRAQSLCGGAEDLLSEVCAPISIGFYLQDRQQEDRGNRENKHDGPGPGIRCVKNASHSAAGRSRLSARGYGSESRCKDPML